MRTWVKQAGRSPSLISLMVQLSPDTRTLARATARTKKNRLFRSLYRVMLTSFRIVRSVDLVYGIVAAPTAHFT
jgi:hypothetical protein